jgi:DNA-binding SARP family transcriptional activator
MDTRDDALAERWSAVTVRVYLTGNVAVEDGDLLVSERRFPARQGRLAVAILAWERHRAISSDELAEIVWDGEPPNAWRSALRAIVSKLRTALGESATIEQAFGCYQLRLPVDAWVDVEACDAAIHEAESALLDDASERAMGWALVANAIARRPFLAGADSEWTEHRREHLRQVRVRALEVRGQVSLLNGDHVGTVTDAEIILGLDPYRETALTLLMRAHLAAGNPAQALAAYEELRVGLAKDLGTSPSAESEAVFLDALAASGALTRGAGSARSRAVRRPPRSRSSRRST